MSKEAETVHAIVAKALDTLMTARPAVHGISADSAFALGEAAGHLARVRALLGRDIDQAALAAVVEPRRRRSRARQKIGEVDAGPGNILLQQQ
jgi:hypothetical protein